MRIKTALVTGGSRGLGFEFCRQLLKRGCTVVMTARDEANGLRSAEKLKKAGGKLHVVPMDLETDYPFTQLAEVASQYVDCLDLLVNNAGINARSSGEEQDFLRASRLSHLDSEVLVDMIRINALAPLFITRAMLPLLAKSRNPKVANISSWLGSVKRKTTGGNYAYAASKTTLNMLSRTLAFDLVRDGITVLMLNPGWVQTDMGGSRAKLTPEASVNGLLQVIDDATSRDAGKFFQWDGTEHPW